MADTQKDAADSKTAQQRVEIELNRFRERAAIAERDLLELQQRVADRHLTPEHRSQLIAALAQGPSGHVDIFCDASTQEPCKFAKELLDALSAAGWETTLNTFVSAATPPRADTILLRVRDVAHAPLHAAPLQTALQSIGIPALGENDASMALADVHLYVMSR